MKNTWITTCIVMSVVMGMGSVGMAKDKVLYVDSYHEGYAWSDGITGAIQQELGDDVELEIIRMDTKRNPSEEFKTAAAERVKAQIEAFQPDVVIASDDNASKYLIVPFYKDAALPFVFCGVNWDASGYGFPCKNVTGMIEVTPVDGLVSELGKLAKGAKVGFLAVDTITGHKELDNMKAKFGMDPVAYFAKDFEDYKKGFQQLQDECDLVILDSDGGLFNEYKDEMSAFAVANTKVPTGSCYDFMSPYCILSYAKDASEQGQWSALQAKKILGGTSPADIPVTMNEKGIVVVNVKLAEKANIAVPYELISVAQKVIE